MGLRETNWHQEVIWKRVGIEDKATHEGGSYMVGHTEFWGRVLGLGTLCCYFLHPEGSSDAFHLLSTILSFLIL